MIYEKEGMWPGIAMYSRVVVAEYEAVAAYRCPCVKIVSCSRMVTARFS